MAQYINKDTLISEIERKMEERDNSRDEAMWNNELWPETEYSYRSREDEVIIDLINTLEVKEVDLDAEWERYFEHRGEMATVNVKHLAKHFFELGVNTNNPLETDLETEQRIKKCPFREVICNRYEDNPIECDGRCSWAVDYPKLKELKAQEGE